MKEGGMVKKWFVISVILLVFLLLVSCEQAPEFPRMTAPEVCQYVNQALPSEYIQSDPVIRVECRYTALNAHHLGEGEWLVNINVLMEPQRLTEGKWVATPLFETKTYVAQYYFSEVTGAIMKK